MMYFLLFLLEFLLRHFQHPVLRASKKNANDELDGLGVCVGVAVLDGLLLLLVVAATSE